MSAPPVSKLEYLKKYMSSSKKEDLKVKKKKLKPILKARAGVRIFDDEIDLKKIKAGYEVDEDLVETQEDAPQVAAVVDERSIELRTQQDFIESSKWKRLAADESTEGKKDKRNETFKSSKKSSSKDGPSSKSSREKSSRNRHDSDSDPSPPRRRHDSESDASPPRRQQYSNPSPPPQRKDSKTPAVRNNQDSDSDASPPRRGKEKETAARRRHDNSDSDKSPPRRKKELPPSSPKRKRRGSHSDPSPPRRKGGDSRDRGSRRRHDSGSDQSPPPQRKEPPPSSPKRKRKGSHSDPSPPRRKGGDSRDRGSRPRHDSGSDQSPPRQRKGAPPSSPRRKRRDSDPSPPLRKDGDGKSKSSSSSASRKVRDASPGGARVDADGDLSPVRSSGSKRITTLDGKRAGLQTGKSLRIETEEFRRRESESFQKLDKSLTGQEAQTRVRAAKLREIEANAEIEREKKAKLKQLKEATDRWSKGVKQQEAQSERLASDIHEMSKPLARAADDEDLERLLRDQERDGDPMAKYLAKKKSKWGDGKPVRPVYRGPAAAPNRFGILPGYRWDGIDRSNGFEKMYFEKQNKSVAIREEAYKWSVSDM